jgi:penicillin-binding protein 1A
VATRTVPKRKGPSKHAPRRSPTAKKAGRKRRGFFLRFWWLWATPLVLLLAVAATLMYVYARMELPDAPPGAKTTNITDRSGQLITTFHAEVDRTVIAFRDMPQHLKDAVIASEDKNFYEHKGISVWGILRAAWADVRNRRLEQGGSTITQQYVKTVFTGNEKTVLRKVKEAMLAMKLERKFSKDQILSKYLNTIYFGRGAYGVQAAARTYFGIRARDLDLNQAATLAGLIPAPESFNPITHPEESLDRRNLVLGRMVTEGYITQSRADAIRREPIEVVRRVKPHISDAPDFVKYVRTQLIGEFGAEEVLTGGLRVRTTLDLDWQRAAEEAIAARLPEPDDPFVALVAIDPRSGAIRAIVGGKDRNSTNFSFATEGKRHAGSAFKPFTLAAAMEQGISLYSTWNGPSSITIDDPRCFDPSKDPPNWQPSNAGDSSAGSMSLLSATANSVNTIYAQLVTDLGNGASDVAEIARRVGIRSELQPYCSLALGTGDVSPFEMASAYSTFANRGGYNEPTGIAEVKKNGANLSLSRPEERRAMAENDADLVTYALQQVVTSGTGRAANIGRPAAGKTGTSQDAADAWFCGYTPQLATCVWMGYRKRVPMHDIGGFSNIYGGTIPALIWHDFMTAAMDGQDVLDFPYPDFSGNTDGPFDPPDEDPPPTTPPSSPSPSPEPTTPSPEPTTPEPTTPPPTQTTQPPPDP